MQDTRVGDWMQTYSGIAFYPLDPRGEEIAIVDIAKSLSMQCRYAGHVKRFYSVAEHSVLVSQHVKPENALWGLLHDASEAYLVDIPKPLKPFITNYKDIEANLMSVIYRSFGLAEREPIEIKEVDTRIVFNEREVLLNPSLVEWGFKAEPLPNVHIQCLSPDAAFEVFINRYLELMAQFR